MSTPRRMLAAAQPVTLTLWPSRKHPLGRRSQLTWGRFVERYVGAPEPSLRKEQVAGFALATFDGDRRALDRVRERRGRSGAPRRVEVTMVRTLEGLIETVHEREPIVRVVDGAQMPSRHRSGRCDRPTALPASQRRHPVKRGHPGT